MGKRPKDKSVATYTFRVTGVTFANKDGERRQDLISFYAAPGKPVDLLRDHSNPHSPDDTAVSVFVSGKQIGHIPEDSSHWVSKKLDDGFDWDARILDVTGGSDEKPTLGIVIEVAFWKGSRPPHPFRRGYENRYSTRPETLRHVLNRSEPEEPVNRVGRIVFAAIMLTTLLAFGIAWIRHRWAAK